MNRLLRIGFDTLLTSITPILGWFLLGILIGSNLINIFTFHKQIANLFRIICSFFPSPFCTSIGLFVSVVYQLVFTNCIIKKNNLNMEMKENLVKRK